MIAVDFSPIKILEKKDGLFRKHMMGKLRRLRIRPRSSASTCTSTPTKLEFPWCVLLGGRWEWRERLGGRLGIMVAWVKTASASPHIESLEGDPEAMALPSLPPGLQTRLHLIRKTLLLLGYQAQPIGCISHPLSFFLPILPSHCAF